MALSSTVSISSIIDCKYCYSMDHEVWDRLWEIGDPGALEFVESNPELSFKDRSCETSS